MRTGAGRPNLGIIGEIRREFPLPGSTGFSILPSMVTRQPEKHEPQAEIARHLVLLRGRRVIFDQGLAAIYGVTTKRLNEQVRRNLRRFPEDFLLQVTAEELEILRSQNATSSWGGRRYRPLAFTEHGAIQVATILNSPQAVQMSVYVVRAFVRLRELQSGNAALSRKLDELEHKYRHHDEAIIAILSALRELASPPPAKRRGIGFTADLSEK